MSEQPPQSQVTFVNIDADRAGQRLDNFLLGHLKGVPKSLVYRIVRKGEVRVNKGRAKVDYRVRAGDIVRIPPLRLPDPAVAAPASEQLKLLLERSVLFEDKGLIIINKPSGLAVHGGSGINLGLIEAFRQLRPQERSLELVHRLDRETSGCIMIAKKRSILRYLHQELREGRVQKYYQALVVGQWPEHTQTVRAPLKKNELSSGERIVRVDADGKPSQTEFHVLQRFRGCSLVEARPITGRTHQIRVHARFAGHPLVGDSKYGDDDVNRKMKAVGVNRLFLHATVLSLKLPQASDCLRVEAPLDSRLQDSLSKLSLQISTEAPG